MENTDNEHREVKKTKRKGLKMQSFLKKIQEHDLFPSVREGYYLVLDNILLFVGVILTASSILSFDHGRYCDGVTTDGYSCVNSATYYQYDGVTIFFFVLGALLISFWYVKRTTEVLYE